MESEYIQELNITDNNMDDILIAHIIEEKYK